MDDLKALIQTLKSRESVAFTKPPPFSPLCDTQLFNNEDSK